MAGETYRIPDCPTDYNEKIPWNSDKLHRRQYADILTALIGSIDQSYVLGINAGWGHGKSLFLRMWRDDLVNNQGRHCILFDAWSTDYGDDPLLALMGAIDDYVTNRNPDQSAPVRGSMRRVWKMGGGFLRTMSKHLCRAGVKYAALKGLDLVAMSEEIQDDLRSAQEGDDAARKAFADVLAESAADLYGKYMQQKASVEGLREHLRAVAEHLGCEDFPLIIMVDELDRCRPDYALLTLERIKHLFAVPGIVFVLALEGKSLARTVNRLYGLEIQALQASGASGVSDSEVYIRRFIDLEYRLPEPQMSDFVEFLCENFGLNDLAGQKAEKISIQGIVCALAKALGLSLRDVGQVVSCSATIAKAYGMDWSTTCLAIFMIVLRREASGLYEKIISEKRIPLRYIFSADSGYKRLLDIKEPEKAFLEAGMSYVFSPQQVNSEWEQFHARRTSEDRGRHDKAIESSELRWRMSQYFHSARTKSQREILLGALEFTARLSASLPEELVAAPPAPRSQEG